MTDKSILYPLVEDSSVYKWNLYYLVIPYLILASITYPILPVYYAALALAVPFFMYLIFLQKQFKANLKMWKKKPGEVNAIGIDSANRKISMGGYELNFSEIEYVKIYDNEPPKMQGITKYIMYAFFLNCRLEIQTKGNRKIYMPLHSMSEIKKVVNLLSKGDFQVSFDQKIYRLCGLQG